MIKTKKLNDGIKLVMEKIPHLQSLSLGIWIKAGAVDETPQTAGISHLIEHMMFKGTEKRTAKQLAEDVDKFGGQINAFTSKEATCYHIKALSDNLDKAAEILLDMLLHSKMDPAELEKEKSVIYEEIKMVQDTPDDDAHETIQEMVFQDTPLENSILGNNRSLQVMNQNDIRDYIRKEYSRDSMVFAIAGNFDEKQVIDLFCGKLSQLTETKKKNKVAISEAVPEHFTKIKDIEQTHICLAVRGVELEHRLFYALNLLTNIIGGSMSSRLFQTIREEKGLAYSVYSMCNSFSNAGYFNIYAGVAHDKAEETICEIKRQLKLLKQKGISAEELTTAKEQMKSAYIFGQENVNGRMFSIGKNMLISGKIHTPEEVLGKFNQVTMKDIMETAEKITDIKKYCAVAITNRDIDLKRIVEA